MKQIELVFACLLAMLLSGCGMMGLPFSGQVTVETTGLPLEGVIVVALWEGEVNPVADSSHICYHAETAVSDEQGKFRIPGWIGGRFGVMDSGIRMLVYKRGYMSLPKDSKSGQEMQMKVFTGSESERIEYLGQLSAGACSMNDENNKNLVRFNKAIYDEALAVGGKYEAKEILKEIRITLDSAKLGVEEAHKRISEGWYAE